MCTPRSCFSACREGRGCTPCTCLLACRKGTRCTPRSCFSACRGGTGCSPRTCVSPCRGGKGCTQHNFPFPSRASIVSLPSRLVYYGITEIPRASACGYRIVATVRNACRWSGSVRKEHDTRALGHEVWFTRGSRIHSSFGSAFIAVVFSRYSRSVVHVKGQWVCRVPEWVGSVCRVAETPSRAWPVPRFPRRRRVGARVVAVCGTAARPGVPINTT